MKFANGFDILANLVIFADISPAELFYQPNSFVNFRFILDKTKSNEKLAGILLYPHLILWLFGCPILSDNDDYSEMSLNLFL